MKHILLVITCLFAFSSQLYSQRNFSESLMMSTYKIKDGKTGASGTAFILCESVSDTSLAGYTVLITAKHVLDGIKDSIAILELREKETHTLFEHKLQIRSGNQNLYVCHDNADIAVIALDVPSKGECTNLSTGFLADDALLDSNEIAPGQDVNALGYPFGYSANKYGYSVLRSAKIASYPLLPTRIEKTFFIDMSVFGGNSGGPVYYEYINPLFIGKAQYLITDMKSIKQKTQFFILGLVIEETTHEIHTETRYESKIQRVPLGVATVVHASLIKDTIAKLKLRELYALQVKNNY